MSEDNGRLAGREIKEGIVYLSQMLLKIWDEYKDLRWGK